METMKHSGISKIQEHFWLLNELSANSPSYNIFSILKIKGIPVIEHLQKAISIILTRHEILRASFRQEDLKIVQAINEVDQFQVSIPVISLNRPFDENGAHAEIENEVNTPFDLGNPPLFRIKLFIYSNDTSVLTINFHHIIIDTRSEMIFSGELSEYYNLLVRGSIPQPENKPIQYSEYTENVKAWYNSNEYHDLLNSWAAEFPEQINKLELPVDFSGSTHLPPSGTGIFFTIDKELIARVSKYASENGANTFRVLLASYATLLHKLTEKETIIIGVPMTNRVRPITKKIIGPFVNTLPLKIDFSGAPSCREILYRVKTSLSHNLSRQEIPLLDLVSCIKADRSSTNSFFQTGFTFKSQMQLEIDGLEIKPLEIKRKGSQLDLFFTLWEKEDGFCGYAEYNTLLFKEKTILRWIEMYKAIIEESIKEPDKDLSSIKMLSKSDENTLISWNNTDSIYEKNVCLHRKLEHHARIKPDSIAIYYADKKLTYRELNQHANKLAHFLISKGIVPDDLVPICLERSPEMMIGIYAILKAGGAYVPVDPGAPAERLTSILDDAKPKLILATEKSGTNLPQGGFPIINLDSILSNPLSDDITDPDVPVNSHNLAYIIYTSGSTGIPKGVMIEHHSVMNRLGWMQNAYPLTHSDVLVQKTPVTFDVSVWELFWWSFVGASLVLPPIGAEKEPEKLVVAIKTYNITVIHFVPSMFGVFLGFLDIRKEQDKIRSLRNIFLSGEALPPDMVNDFRKVMNSYPNPEMINLYGPTEATVDVSYYHCPKEKTLDTMFIGKPIANTKLLILDKNHKIQPIGLPGELVITGVNLSRGYLNRDNLNKEKFIEIRYFDGSLLRAYRTGDLAKWTDEGEIFYIGRLDNQVKIRGFRIELGDIEAKIHEHSLVHNCAVIVSEDTEPRSLIAYICPKQGAILAADTIRKFLHSKLPEYMIPPNIVFLENLPLTSSGKLNRKALPKPDRANTADAVVLPANSCEKKLVELWKGLLRIENISINDNFFDIGGNSLLAISLATLISKEFGIAFNTISLFEYPSIRSQSNYIVGGLLQEDSTGRGNLDEKVQRMKDVEYRRRRT